MTVALSPEEFYRLRDDRTNRLTASRDYQHLRVRLVADEPTVSTFSGQVQLLVSANMLARWCRQIEFGFPDAPLVEPLRLTAFRTLHERIAAEVNGADPFGRFTFRAPRSKDVQYALKVGGGASNEPVDFTIDGDGWLACAGKGDRSFGISYCDQNPVGPAFAACIGVADAFKVATGIEEAYRVRSVAFSAFHLQLVDLARGGSDSGAPEHVEVGNMDVVGVGSVGSAVIYLSAMLPLRGFLRLIDHDTVSIENLNRSPLLGMSHVGRPKVEVVKEYLRSVMPVEAHPCRYDEFIGRYGRGNVDVLLPLANEFGVRSVVENNFPPIQLYGTTTPDWGINYHRHIPLREDCSLCRFPTEGEQAKLVCSKAQIDTAQGERVDAALPFLSMAAAALTVGDLIKLQLPGYPFSPNFAFVDFKDKLQFILSYQRLPQASCACRSRSSKIHKRYLTATRFGPLSAEDDA